MFHGVQLKAIYWVGGALVLVGGALFLATRGSGPSAIAVGANVRVTIANAQLVLATNASFPIPAGLPGAMTVLITAIDGDEVTGQVVQFDSFGVISGQGPDKFLARFSKSAILP